ncbi:NAD(P)/FAD-dependent oxidoreductase [Psychromarinibacter sp. S121]|uniref:NAD(P)/FAD-dependent oxidoreductase n=1 Tax=Psychromarinibacter sp. S121 TaxID=3415127 RepID=UPI003C7C73A5
MTQRTQYDAIIIGARCAGASTAMLLARSGARVLVADHGQPGTDTMSTHALMRGAVFQLHKWGVLDAIRAEGTPAVRRTTFLYGSEEIDIDIRASGGVDALYAPRRSCLDLALVREAAAAGAEFRFGTGCAGLLHDETGRVTGVRLRRANGQTEDVFSGIVIGADGRRSAVARQVKARAVRTARFTTACTYAYFDGLPDRGFRWHHAPGAIGGIIPTNDGLSCVFVGVTPDRMKAFGSVTPEGLIAGNVPVLADEIAGARRVTSPVVFRGEPGYFRQSAGPGWALVGDAGYFRDPATAHGITDALRDAEILANAIVGGAVAEFPALRMKLSGRFFDLTDRVASLQWTLPELMDLHRQLNEDMKANQKWIAGMTSEMPVAA